MSDSRVISSFSRFTRARRSSTLARSASVSGSAAAAYFLYAAAHSLRNSGRRSAVSCASAASSGVRDGRGCVAVLNPDRLPAGDERLGIAERRLLAGAHVQDEEYVAAHRADDQVGLAVAVPVECERGRRRADVERLAGGRLQLLSG